MLLGCGCDDPAAPREPPPGRPTPAAACDPRDTGTVRGCVTWPGDLPAVPPFKVRGNPLAPPTLARRRQVPNPNAPRIDPATRGVAGAFVFLKGKGAGPARPWDHPPVHVELRDGQITLCQGTHRGDRALVARGGMLEIVSRDERFHSLRARGAVFFGFSLPEPERPLSARLHQPGVVELTSGAGEYWLRAYLLVAETPWCAVTDGEGTFVLNAVPAGEYQLECWLPNWDIARQERDPETGVVSRLEFRLPHRVTRPVHVAPQSVAHVGFTLPASPDDVKVR